MRKNMFWKKALAAIAISSLLLTGTVSVYAEGIDEEILQEDLVEDEEIGEDISEELPGTDIFAEASQAEEPVMEETIDEIEDIVEESGNIETVTEEAADLDGGTASQYLSGATELVVGTIYTVTVNGSYSKKYYHIKPATTCVYDFYSWFDGEQEDDYLIDPYARILDTTGTILMANDDDSDNGCYHHDSGGNFGIRIALTAGVDYYLEAGLYGNRVGEYYFMGQLRPELPISEAAYQPADTKQSSFTAWLESPTSVNIAPGQQIKLKMGTNYTDDLVLELNWYANNNVWLSSGETYSVTFDSEGTYIIRCEVSAKVRTTQKAFGTTQTYGFQVNVAQQSFNDTVSKAKEIAMTRQSDGTFAGTDKAVMNPDNGSAYMKFKAPTTAYYTIEATATFAKIADLCDEQGNKLTTVNGKKKVALDANVTYYLRFTNSTLGNAGECKITIESGSAHNHTLGAWYTVKEADALNKGVEQRDCSDKNCVHSELRATNVLPAFITLNVSGSIPMKTGQKTTAIKVTGLQKGDYVVSWTSSKTKYVKVNKNGKITAKKIAGKKSTITVTTAAGAKAVFKIKTQAGKVKTKKLTVPAKKLKLQKKQKYTIIPVIDPITSQDKITYTTSNKKIAKVSSDGVITARKAGKATITVKSGGKTVKIKVTVK